MGRAKFTDLLENECNSALSKIDAISKRVKAGDKVDCISKALGMDVGYINDVIDNGLCVSILNYGADLFLGFRNDVCKLICEGKSDNYIYEHLLSKADGLKRYYFDNNIKREKERVRALKRIASENAAYSEFDGVTLKFDFKKYMEALDKKAENTSVDGVKDRESEAKAKDKKEDKREDSNKAVKDTVENAEKALTVRDSSKNEVVSASDMHVDSLYSGKLVECPNDLRLLKMFSRRIKMECSKGECNVANIDESESVYQSYVHSISQYFRLFDFIEGKNEIILYAIYTRESDVCIVEQCRSRNVYIKTLPLEFYDIPLRGKRVKVNVVNYKEYTCHDCCAVYYLMDKDLLVDVDGIKMTSRLRKMCYDWAKDNSLYRRILSEKYVTKNLMNQFFSSNPTYIDTFGCEEDRSHEIDVAKYIDTLAEIYFVYGNVHVRWIRQSYGRKIVYIAGEGGSAESGCIVCGGRESLLDSRIVNITDIRLEDKYTVYGHIIRSKCNACGYESGFIDYHISDAFDQIERAKDLNTKISNLKDAIDHAWTVLDDSKSDKSYYRIADKYLGECFDYVQGHLHDIEFKKCVEGPLRVKILGYLEALDTAVNFLKSNSDEINGLRNELREVYDAGYQVE